MEEQYYFSAGTQNRYGSYTNYPVPVVETIMAMEPSKHYTEQQIKKLLGGEVALWGEFMTYHNVHLMLNPRIAAFTEIYWAPKKDKINWEGLASELKNYISTLNS